MRTQFFLFSADRPGCDSDFRYTKLNNALHQLNINYLDVDGCYKNETEKSVLVDARHEKSVLELAKEFGQESILFVDRKNNAYLIYLADGNTEKLKGKFQEVTKQIALSLDAYTKCCKTGKYYAVV